jgi:hypothetical protein
MGFKDIFFGREPEVVTKTVEDPAKKAVASPLSRFLASEVGRGVPRYQGRITGQFPEQTEGITEDFLGLDAESFFEERIKAPALETFREDLLPLVREEFAGSLSGSGRFRTEEEAASRFTRGLAQTRAELEMQLPQAQFQMAQQIKQEADKEAAAQYKDWLKSLPQFSPALEQSLIFLNKATGTGTEILSFLDQGSEGILGDLIRAAGTLGGAAIGAGFGQGKGGIFAPKGGA